MQKHMSEHLALLVPYNSHLTQIPREQSTSFLPHISMRSAKAVSHSLASTWIAEKLVEVATVSVYCVFINVSKHV